MANPVGGFTKVITPAVVVSLSAYTSGDVVGGEIELENVFRRPGETAILQAIYLTDEDEQDEIYHIMLFDANPALTYTDNGACPDFAATDTPKLVARIPVVAADWVSIGLVAHATVTNLGRGLQAAKGATSLWMVIVTLGTPDFSASDHLRLKLAFLQD